MTKIVHTGKTLDVGKGNPMILFDVYQDKSNSIEVEAVSAEQEDIGAGYQALEDEPISDDDDVYAEAAPAAIKAAAPRVVAATPTADAQARTRAILAGRRSG
jgi:hypothetical protein